MMTQSYDPNDFLHLQNVWFKKKLSYKICNFYLKGATIL